MIKKLLFAGALALAFNSVNAQSVIFEDSFETYTDFAIANVGSWTLRDVDLKTTYGFQGVTFANSGVAKSFQVFNSTTTNPVLDPTETSDWTARTGDKVMVCFAATSSPWNNDWLISPQIQLAANGNKLSFWAKSCDADYGLERFRVYVSTTGTAVANFASISNVITTPDDATWYEYTYDLDAYAGQKVYIGIQCTSQDQFGFAIDDFKVEGNILGVSDVNKKSVSVYPNPTTDYLTFSQKVNSAEVYDMAGKLVSSPAVVDSKIDVKSLQNGTYVLKINTEAGPITQKFIKK